MKTTKIAILTFFAVLLVAFSAEVRAETDVAKQARAKAEAAVKEVTNICKKDIEKYCDQVTPGDGRLWQCALAHEDKIEDDCYWALFDLEDQRDMAVSNMWRAWDMCAADIETLCADVPEGGGQIAQCLADKKSKLQTPCRAEVAAFEERLK